MQYGSFGRVNGQALFLVVSAITLVPSDSTLC